MIKNIILKILTLMAGASFAIGMCGIDGPNPVTPTLMMVAGLTWIALFGYANGWTK